MLLSQRRPAEPFRLKWSLLFFTLGKSSLGAVFRQFFKRFASLSLWLTTLLNLFYLLRFSATSLAFLGKTGQLSLLLRHILLCKQ